MELNTQLKTKADVHLARKIWHFSGVILIAICYHNLSRALALQILTVVATVFIFADFYRQRSQSLNQLFLHFGKYLMRENERAGISGTTYLLLGVLIIVAFFPPSVVVLSLLFLAVADPIASYFGVRFGRDRLVGRKTLQGSIAAFFACSVVAAGYFYSHNMMTERIVIVSLLAGFIAALAEILPIRKLDDNLVLPVVSSCLLWVVYHFFGGF